MDKPISVGDLVQMVRPAPCCGNTVGLGNFYRVYGITSTINCTCLACGKRYWDVLVVVEDYSLGGHLRSRLKRIPPPEETSDVKSDEEIHA